MTYEKWIDVTKGIGILLVILGHNDFDQSFLTVIHTFNMPLFFYISGYLFHYKKYKLNPNNFIFQKFKRLVVPYFVTNIIILCTFTLLFFFKMNSFNGNSPVKYLIGVFYGNGAPLNPPTIYTNLLSVPSWFLLGLFCASLILYLLTDSHEKYGLAFSSFLCFLVILFGFRISKYILLPWSFDIACVSMIFMFSGYLVNYYKINWLYNNFKSNLYNSICILLLFIVISINGAVDMNTRTYSNLFFFSIAGLLGTYITIEFAKKISKKESLLMKIFAYFGKNSILILLYHTFIPIVILDTTNNFCNIREIISHSPILYSLTMLVSSIVTIIIIKRLPFLDRIYF
ncbi:O-acetyl transferase [Methanosarcina lacustris Z-7289]|uniref:O-acetyl transferase n=1 Tax=Methanosarcina lacustris Z-7289 TaxID=1434111 RepID=A0A0E3WS81_9EURY|nr:acyltransferase family protein [Methanosarcina lacustris]AKB73990.1 O-acetyl transferase [Methanosarcina lacustris Z-7289]